MSTRRNPPSGASRSPRQTTAGNRSRSTAATRSGGSRGKKAAPSHGSRIRKGRLLLAMLLACGLGLLIWYSLKRPASAVAVVPPALADDGKPARKQPAPAQPEAADNPERFEFYDILPNQQVLPTRTPVNRPSPRPLPAGKEARPTTAADAAAPIRWLQAGAFRNASEADRRRAEIRLLALPARVQEGRDSQGTPLFRVLAGPFNSSASGDAARRTLATAGLDAIPVSDAAVNPAGNPP